MGSGTRRRPGSRKDGLSIHLLARTSLEGSTGCIRRMRGAWLCAHSGAVRVRVGMSSPGLYPFCKLRPGCWGWAPGEEQVAEGGQPIWGCWASGLSMWGIGPSCHCSPGGDPCLTHVSLLLPAWPVTPPVPDVLTSSCEMLSLRDLWPLTWTAWPLVSPLQACTRSWAPITACTEAFPLPLDGVVPLPLVLM